MIDPKIYSISTLVGKRCPINREHCLLSPSKRYQERYPESVEAILKAWEDKGEELL